MPDLHSTIYVYILSKEEKNKKKDSILFDWNRPTQRSFFFIYDIVHLFIVDFFLESDIFVGW